jgi:Tol biopolymer transport system component
MHSRAKLAALSCGCSLLSLAASAPGAGATTPGRNGRIVFAIDRGHGSQLETVRPDGRDLRRITHVAGDASSPDWSPDGRRIVFEIDTQTTARIALVRRGGGGLVMLPSHGGFDGQPAFTPDGRRIVFEHFDPATNDDAIWSERLDGSHRKRLGSGPAGATDPNLSPDGKTLSFVSFNGAPNGQALATMPFAGGPVRRLRPFTTDVAIKHDWAPDGRRLVFSDNADRQASGHSANIATIRPGGTGVRYLTHLSGGAMNAFAGSYSPDGRWIVYRLEDHGRYGLYRMHPNGSHVQTILPLSAARPRYIDWGSRVAR